jgi:transcriptional regulator with XRE-family HTH domain
MVTLATRPNLSKMRLKDLAESVGVSPAYLSQIRRGVRPMSAKIKQKLSELASDDLRWWATLDSNQRPQSYQDCALTN